METPRWIDHLKHRWKMGSGWQVVVVLIVFACTGFTVLFIKKPLLEFLAGKRGDTAWASALYYLFILPLYNILLLGYGWLFGQFTFFWSFEKRSFQRIMMFFKKRGK